MEQLTQENIKSLLGISGIYKIRIHDKDYVGSSVSIGHRLKHHLWALVTHQHHNRTMQSLYKKYRDVFFIKIEDCEPDNLIKREKHYIDLLKPYMNHILDPQKIVRDDVYKQRLSAGLKKAYAEGLRPHNDKPVHQYHEAGDYIRTYANVSLAARSFMKTDPSAICMCARGDNYTAYGFRWSYEKAEMLPPFKKKYGYKPIVQMTLDGEEIREWCSAIEAQEILGITNISRAATKNKTAGGYRWKYKS